MKMYLCIWLEVWGSMNVKEQKASWKCILFYARFSFAATYFESIYYVYLNQRSIYMTQMHSGFNSYRFDLHTSSRTLVYA